MTWMEEYKAMKLSRLTKKQLDLLENGPHSLSQAWLLGAMHQDYKRIMGIKEKEPKNCQSSLKEFFRAHP
jgi:hypothetical protein